MLRGIALVGMYLLALLFAGSAVFAWHQERYGGVVLWLLLMLLPLCAVMIMVDGDRKGGGRQ